MFQINDLGVQAGTWWKRAGRDGGSREWTSEADKVDSIHGLRTKPPALPDDKDDRSGHFIQK